MTIRASSGTAPGLMTTAGNGPGGHDQSVPVSVGLGLLDLQWRFEYGSLRNHPPRLESDGSIIDGQSTQDIKKMGLPAELELRVFGNGQYYGRFLIRPRPGSRPAKRARLVAVALAEQVGHAYSSARVCGTAR